MKFEGSVRNGGKFEENSSDIWDNLGGVNNKFEELLKKTLRYLIKNEGW